MAREGIYKGLKGFQAISRSVIVNLSELTHDRVAVSVNELLCRRYKQEDAWNNRGLEEIADGSVCLAGSVERSIVRTAVAVLSMLRRNRYYHSIDD